MNYLPPPDVVANALTRIALVLPLALHVFVSLWFTWAIAHRVVTLVVLVKTGDADDADTLVARLLHLLVCGAVLLIYVVSGFYFLWRAL